jgi:hypothetical protein
MGSLIKRDLEESCLLALIEFTKNVFQIHIISVNSNNCSHFKIANKAAGAYTNVALSGAAIYE